jgi:hypothetical protein
MIGIFMTENEFSRDIETKKSKNIMKIKNKTLEKYKWFIQLGQHEKNRPLQKIEFVEDGVSAVKSFHSFETYGKLLPTNEPETLEKYLAGKAFHGITVENVAESFASDRTIFSKEIKQNYPVWVAEEIFYQSEKICLQKLGYVPTFVKTRKDLSEL